MTTPIVVNFGGGRNSTALLVGLHERGVRPNLIIFADTGDEKPETYEHLWLLHSWLLTVRFPPVVILRRKIRRGRLSGTVARLHYHIEREVRAVELRRRADWADEHLRLSRTCSQNDLWDDRLCCRCGWQHSVWSNISEEQGLVTSLEKECYANRTLPGKAFGYNGCSVKWKAQVVDGALKRAYRQHIRNGGRVRRMLGIDFGELHRAKFQPTPPFEWEYPLIDWRWDREACGAALERAGIHDPGKSACFYCPSSRKAEVLDLMARHRDLFNRAVAMERQAARHLGPYTRIRGLGRHWSWEEVGDAHRLKLDVAVDESHCDMPCGAACGS